MSAARLVRIVWTIALALLVALVILSSAVKV
jgi:hypothetical protein